MLVPTLQPMPAAAPSPASEIARLAAQFSAAPTLTIATPAAEQELARITAEKGGLMGWVDTVVGIAKGVGAVAGVVETVGNVIGGGQPQQQFAMTQIPATAGGFGGVVSGSSSTAMARTATGGITRVEIPLAVSQPHPVTGRLQVFHHSRNVGYLKSDARAVKRLKRAQRELNRLVGPRFRTRTRVITRRIKA
jgi:hypothetical protein